MNVFQECLIYAKKTSKLYFIPLLSLWAVAKIGLRSSKTVLEQHKIYTFF